MEFIHFECVSAEIDEVTGFVNDAGLANLEELQGIIDRYLLLPLVAAYAIGIALALDGDETLVVADADADSALRD